MPIQTRSNPHKSASMETGASVSDQRLLTDLPSSEFKKYRCRWLGCKAVLHNWDNLKRHLKLHKRVDATNDGVPCKWAGCQCSPCASEVEWANHVHVHLEEVKEIFGLGPAALTSGNCQEIPSQVTLANDKFQNKDIVLVAPFRIDYLYHAGTQVTPIAKMATDDYHFVPPRGFPADRDFNTARGTSANGRKRNRSCKAAMIILTTSRPLGVGIVNLEAKGVGSKLQRSGIPRITHPN
jgi:hypothetical protein